MNDKMVFNGKYFCIYEYIIKNQKTPILRIFSKNGISSFLGEIKWYGAWRKFCFFPHDNTIWDNKCLNDLTEFLKNYNRKWKESKTE